MRCMDRSESFTVKLHAFKCINRRMIHFLCFPCGSQNFCCVFSFTANQRVAEPSVCKYKEEKYTVFFVPISSGAQLHLFCPGAEKMCLRKYEQLD